MRDKKGNLGYRRITLDWHMYLGHRIIYKLVTGLEPSCQLDHRNECKHDNRWNNLREATGQQNKWNEGLRRSNTTGVKNVYRYGDDGRYRATIAIGPKKMKHIGLFDTIEEAKEAAVGEARRIHGEFYNELIRRNDG